MPRSPRRARLAVRELEPRAVPTIFVVNSTADTVAADGQLTLREALTAANTNAPAGDAPAGSPGLDAIGFAIGTGPVTISPASALPAITEAVTLDGTSQPGFAGKPLVVLDGSAAGKTAGLTLTGHTGSTIRGLVINGFQNEGILVIGGGKHQIVGNYIGTDAAGTAAVPNKNGGVALTAGTTDNVVGGATAADANLISGNGDVVFSGRPGFSPPPMILGPGVFVTGAGTAGNRVVGNLIGTDVTGTVALPNQKGGVFVADGAAGTVVGGGTAGERNVISGNAVADVQVGETGELTPAGVPPTNTRVVGNYIGTTPDGGTSIAGGGVEVAAATNTHVGEAGAGNLIGPSGVRAGGSGTRVQGNRIGTTADGMAAIANAFNFGTGVSAGGDTLVGGTGSGEGNQISGLFFGINALSTGNVRIEGNLIGTDPTGTKAIPNAIVGVTADGTGVTVGGADPAAANVIAGNGGHGVEVSGGATVQGNLIGVARDGVTPLGNKASGVEASGPAKVVGNTIANNGGAGVAVLKDVTGAEISANSIHDNLGLGIDVGFDGPTPNDPADIDVGAQNSPVLSAAVVQAATTVSGVLSSKAGTAYRIEFFAAPEFFNSGSLSPGQVYLGSTTVTTNTNPDGTGTAAFTATGLAAVPAGLRWVTATATDLTTGDTSEFAPVVRAVRGDVRVFQAGGPTEGVTQVVFQAHEALVAGATATRFPGQDATARVATADVNGDGVPDYVVGTGPGVRTRVDVYSGADGKLLASVQPFEDTFTGGVFVAAGDLDADGFAEVVVCPDLGGGPVVAVYPFRSQLAGLNAPTVQPVRLLGVEDPNFRGGARPAVGDVNGDGRADLVVAAGYGGGPRVALFDGPSVLAGPPTHLMPDFFAFEETLRNGAFVAARDVTGDGVADLAFGGGPGGAPRVRLFDGKALLGAAAFTNLDAVPAAQVANFFAGDPGLHGGVRVALVTVDGDDRADLVVGSGEGEAARVRVYKAPTLTAGGNPGVDQELELFGGAALSGGVFVG